MNKFTLFNSLKQRKERFLRLPGKVGLYVCGITPDAPMHAGHAFVFTFFDVLVRYLRFLGFKATYVQNVTDIDDDILRRAKAKGKNWKVFGQKYTKEFLENMRWLGNRRPDVFPKATKHIPEMIGFVRVLLKKGFAYEKNGSVYFSLAKDRDWGKLSRLSRKRMFQLAKERGNYPDDPNKKDPLDFVLWQAQKKGEPSWPSPWGKGRPGWHIECSAMAMKYLGQTLDIEGGGSDLIFPHHESSIAQSESATGRQYARFWLHAGMVRYKKAKMAKSLGNVVLVGALRKKYSANAFRIFLLSHHYRSSWTFQEKKLKKAQSIAKLFEKALKVRRTRVHSLDASRLAKRFFQALNNDMDMPRALAALQALAREMIRQGKKKKLGQARAFLKIAFSLLGLTIK